MQNWIGHGISIAGLLISVFFGAMWLGSLENDVRTLKTSSVTAERVARLEVRIDLLAESNRDLKQSVDKLVTKLERSR